ncbi:cryptochrome/photolyase family protein [Oceanospirillum sp.]|uniref:cryptochrome/photolyase family protein n=1 Tax=Oceanospirillum sp. TaxID=2021254 RepID=UPI003A8D4E3F
MSQLVWFRSDLRVHDNPALFTACQQAQQNGSGVIACFLRPLQQWQSHDWGQNRIRYTERCLLDLKEELESLHIPLICLDVATFAGQIPALLQLCQRLNCDQIFANEEPELNERQRDQQLIAQAEPAGIHCQLFHDQSILPLGSVLKNDGTPYRVYTPFRKQAQQMIAQQPVQTFPSPAPVISDTQQSLQPKIESLSLAQSDGVTFQPQNYSDDPIQQRWPATEKEAFHQLELFCGQPINRYKTQRDFPADAKGTSLLSPMLATGKLSVKSCWRAAEQIRLSDPAAAESASTWQGELLWRDFYRHLLVLYPELSRNQPFKKETSNIQWRNAPEDLQRWQEGRTGFPLVDAAMRQLKETGWMHNRLRMLTAVFLSKYLLIDWHEGERWFMQHLVDADLASNNGGWQWAASTGTDAVPYFRLLSPYRQAERFDAQGEFIARFVPELAKLPAKQRTQPKGYVQGYPNPMADLKEGKERMMAAFKAVKSESSAQ